MNHVWSYDFVHYRTDGGRAFRTLNILDEFSRECLTIRVRRKLDSTDVIDALTDLFILRGVPSYIRSDNGLEFVAEAVRKWIAAHWRANSLHRARQPLSTALRLPAGQCMGDGYVESFNARLRDELFNSEIFYSLKEAQIIIESWRHHYNIKRPHSALGYKPPAPESIIHLHQRIAMH